VGDKIAKVLECLAANESQALNRLFEIMRIPSVSTMPEHVIECRSAAAWFVKQFEELGFIASIRETPGQPAVVAHYRCHKEEVPKVLYYGHYDVQPSDPVDEWLTDPFEPSLIDGPNGKQIIGRGAADDKGQVIAWIEALRAHKTVHGDLPVDMIVIVEGEEETGSLNFDYLLKTYREEFQVDFAVVSDGNMWDRNTAAITTQLRGLVYVEVALTTANQDLHSGLFGGSATNAIHAMCTLLAQLKDGEGRIAIPEIYEDIQEPSDFILQSWGSLNFNEENFLSTVGLKVPAGETDRTALERIWSRPTADVNGIWGGYLGTGSKTVIPRQAKAKVSFRLVPGQKPEKVLEGFSHFVTARLPPDSKAVITVLEAAPAVELQINNVWLKDTQRALTDEFGKPPVLIGCGGSLGAVESFSRVLGIPTLLFSFGLENDNVHGPNEKFDLACFRHCARSHARLLDIWS
jgi:acetylornithine deacetylase/succinyl-diaminopimelate desuccinylase-like protein